MIRLLALLIATPALAQEPCGPYDKIVAGLQEQYHESGVGGGLTQVGDAIVEVWASDAGSWTILRIDPNGIACIMAAGQVWQPVPKGDPV